MMHHAIDNRSGDHGIAEIIAAVLKVDVRGDRNRKPRVLGKL
jgi:hypothetical protein